MSTGNTKNALSTVIDLTSLPNVLILISLVVPTFDQYSPPTVTSPKATASGAISTALRVVVVAAFDAADSPPSLTAVTVKVYSVSAVKPVTVNVVSVAVPANSVPL